MCPLHWLWRAWKDGSNECKEAHHQKKNSLCCMKANKLGINRNKISQFGYLVNSYIPKAERWGSLWPVRVRNSTCGTTSFKLMCGFLSGLSIRADKALSSCFEANCKCWFNSDGCGLTGPLAYYRLLRSENEINPDHFAVWDLRRII